MWYATSIWPIVRGQIHFVLINVTDYTIVIMQIILSSTEEKACYMYYETLNNAPKIRMID